MLAQVGLGHRWRPHACRNFTFACNTMLSRRDGKTAWELRYGEPFHGPSIPFGAEVVYHESPTVAHSTPKFAPRGKRGEGVFMGYHTHCGGKWSGDFFVADYDALSQTNLNEHVHVQRVKEVQSDGGAWRFPCRTDHAKPPLPKEAQDLPPEASDTTVADDTTPSETAPPDERPLPPKGYRYEGDRLTRVQKATRPEGIWPELWAMM